MSTHYEVLGVEPDADERTIKKAVQRKQREFHPDVAGPGHEDDYLAVTQAGAVLLDEQSRADYDEALANPQVEVPDEEILDEWIQETEPEPEPEPEPSINLDKSQPEVEGEGFDNPQPVVEDEPSPRMQVYAGVDNPGWFIVGAVGLVVIASLTSYVATVAGLAFGALGLIVGFVVGYMALGTPVQRRALRPRPRVAYSAGIPIIGVLTICGMGAAQVYGGAYGPILGALAIGAGSGLLGYLAGNALWLRRRDRSVMTLKTLRESHWFGATPPGVDAAYVRQALSEVCDETMRVFQWPGGTFTHMVVAGREVYLIRGMSGPSGTWSYAGGSVLVTNSAGVISQAGAGQFDAVVDAFDRAFGNRANVRGIIAAHAPTVTDSLHGDITVVGMSRLGNVIARSGTLINRAVVVDALLAAAKHNETQRVA